MLKRIKKWFIEAEDSLRIYPLNELAEKEIQIHGEGEIYKVEDAYFFWKDGLQIKGIGNNKGSCCKSIVGVDDE